MGHIGFGYGSEWHLMRYMARHRKLLNDKILSVLGKGKCIEWLDFEFDPNSEFLDRELHGLEFLDRTEYAEILETWKIWWPQTGTAPSWDAVAWLHLENGGSELLLIEAKAHVGELKSSCKAEGDSRSRITKAFDYVCEDLGIQGCNDWLREYYQHANRIAVTWFLNNHNKFAHKLRQQKSNLVLSTRLINIYFCGEVHRGWKCPQTEEEWKDAINKRDSYLGLDRIQVELPVHSVFVTL